MKGNWGNPPYSRLYSRAPAAPKAAKLSHMPLEKRRENPWIYFPSGAHHPEPPSPIQALRDNLCRYLSIFRNHGALRFTRTLCHTVQYNTTQHNAMHYTIIMLSWELKLAWGENCSKNRKICAKVDSRIYGRWRLRVMGSWKCLFSKGSGSFNQMYVFGNETNISFKSDQYIYHLKSQKMHLGHHFSWGHATRLP